MLTVLCFYVLGTTADAYLAPALEQISVKLGISEQLAGVTFLAFANGAPDVIAALSAAGSNAGGVGQAVGALTGAGLFVSGVVSGVVILFSSSVIRVKSKVFSRDVSFYIAGLVLLVLTSVYGEFTVVISALFLVLYVVFLVFVGVEEWIEMKAKKARVGESRDGEE